MSINIVIDAEPKDEDIGVILQGLREYNDRHIKRIEKKSYGIYLKEYGKIVGGIKAEHYEKWMFIKLFWVSDQLRGKGYGQKLMAQVEAKAKALGCRTMLVDTYSFQAPKFYLAYGFKQYTQIENNPIDGVARHYYIKHLI